MRLERLIGRKVQWNSIDTAEIVEVFVDVEKRHAGTTVVGHDPKVYAVFDVEGRGLITSLLDFKKLLPEAK